MDDAARHGRAHGEHDPRSRARRVAQCIQVQSPAAADHPQRHQPGHTAGEADAVQQAGVGRIADDDLVAGLQHGEQCVEDARQSARRDHALRSPVVRDARIGPQPGNDRLSQSLDAEERQVAVGFIASRGGTSGLDRGPRRRDVGIEVLQPEHLRIARGVRRIAHLVDADAGNVQQARYRHCLDPRSGPFMTHPRSGSSRPLVAALALPSESCRKSVRNVVRLQSLPNGDWSFRFTDG